VADPLRFAPPRPAELTHWAAPDAGPPAPAVTPDPISDRAGLLSAAAARELAVRLLGPAATTAAWTSTSPTSATALIGGQGYLVVDESDPHGWFTSLGLYQLVGCQVCGAQHQVPVRYARPGQPLPAGVGTAGTRGVLGRRPGPGPPRGAWPLPPRP
jgi:hypothetical protein